MYIYLNTRKGNGRSKPTWTRSVDKNRLEHKKGFKPVTITFPVNRSTEFSNVYTILDMVFVDNFCTLLK